MELSTYWHYYVLNHGMTYFSGLLCRYYIAWGRGHPRVAIGQDYARAIEQYSGRGSSNCMYLCIGLFIKLLFIFFFKIDIVSFSDGLMYAPDNLHGYIPFKEINNQILQANQDNTMNNTESC